MAIHYDPKAKRFRDSRGFVSTARGMRSSIARPEYERAVRAAAKAARAAAKAKKAAAQARLSKKKPPASKPKPKPARKKAAAKPKKARVSHAKPRDDRLPRPGLRGSDIPEWRDIPDIDAEGNWIPPWDREGIVREYPEEAEWLDMDEDYAWHMLTDDWGDVMNEDTAS